MARPAECQTRASSERSVATSHCSFFCCIAMLGLGGCSLLGGLGAVSQPVVQVGEFLPEVRDSVAKIGRLPFGIDGGVSSSSGFGLGPAGA